MNPNQPEENNVLPPNVTLPNLSSEVAPAPAPPNPPPQPNLNTVTPNSDNKEQKYRYPMSIAVLIVGCIIFIAVSVLLLKVRSDKPAVVYHPPTTLLSAEANFVRDIVNDSPNACAYINESEATNDSPYISCKSDFGTWYKVLLPEANRIIAGSVKPKWTSTKYSTYTEIDCSYGSYPNDNASDNSPQVLLDNFIGGQVWEQTGPDNGWQTAL
jgi:hypothetical protein